MLTGERGFTYLLLLFALAIGAAGLAQVAESVQQSAQREREAELRFRGEAIAHAIERYAALSAASQAPLPQSLDELLEDRRSPVPRHWLRQLYSDPFTGKPDWELILGDAPVQTDETSAGPPAVSVRGIVGVRSRSLRQLISRQWPQRQREGMVLRANEVSFVAAGQTALGKS